MPDNLKHTQLPWVVKVYDYPITSGMDAGKQYYRVSIYPTHLPPDETFDLTDGLTAADAELIVAAVNEHAALKARVAELEADLKDFEEASAKNLDMLFTDREAAENAFTRFFGAHALNGPPDDTWTKGIVDIYEFERAQKFMAVLTKTRAERSGK